MIQPDPEEGGSPPVPRLYRVGCAGRITQFAETGDGRYLITLTGVGRFRVEEELAVTTPFRCCRVAFDAFAADFQARAGEDEVDRPAVLKSLRDFVEANDLKVDWRGIEQAPNEALVNALWMMSPFGPREKQALLEAPDLKSRAEALIALTEIELARDDGDGDDAAIGATMADETPADAPRVDPKLLEILVCPLTKRRLEYDAERQELISREARLAYPIRDGIPIMLPEEARPLTE